MPLNLFARRQSVISLDGSCAKSPKSSPGTLLEVMFTGEANAVVAGCFVQIDPGLRVNSLPPPTVIHPWAAQDGCD